MANVSQATHIGGQIVIECNDQWTCCQREQAREKCRRANAQIERAQDAGTPATVRSAAQNAAAKAGLYGPALATARENITGRAAKGPNKPNSPQQQAAAASAAGAPKCLTDDIANGLVDCDDLAMDHTLDVQLGGNAWPGSGTPLMPLDSSVNGAFGNLIQHTADHMGAGTEVEGLSLVCPPSGLCPTQGYSTGNFQKAFPQGDDGWVTTRIT